MKLEDRLNNTQNKSSKFDSSLKKIEPKNVRDNFSFQDDKRRVGYTKKLFLFVKKNKEYPTLESQSDLSYDEKLNLIDEEKQKAQELRVKKDKKTVLFLRLLSFCVVLYAVFVLYGAFITKYNYNESGKYEPIILTLSDIKEKSDYETVLFYYNECIFLYEDVIDIDYSLSKGANGSTIATKYLEKLNNADSLIRQIKGLDINLKYSSVQNLLVNWLSNDLAVYLQNISTAITTNNSTKMSNALQDRSRTSVDFDTITSNMVGLGSELKGVDISAFKDWSFDNYSKKISE